MAASLVLLLVVLMLLLSTISPPSRGPQAYCYVLRVEVFNNGSAPLPLKYFHCITVFPNTSRQDVEVVEVRWWIDEVGHSSYVLTTTGEGNVEVRLIDAPDVLAPSSRFKLKLTLHVRLRRGPQLPCLDPNFSQPPSAIPIELREPFCLKTGLWDFEDPLVAQLLNNLTAEANATTLSLVESFIEWIDKHVAYPLEAGWSIIRYPNETLIELSGDCDDRANLFIALCRGAGIPCFLQYGVIYEPGVEEDYTCFDGRYSYRGSWLGRHGWAVVYVPPWGWLPVDFTYFEELELREEDGRTFIYAPSPLNHVAGAAVLTKEVIVEGNVTSRDYMASNLRLLNLLKEHNAYLLQVEELRPWPPPPQVQFLGRPG